MLHYMHINIIVKEMKKYKPLYSILLYCLYCKRVHIELN